MSAASCGTALYGASPVPFPAINIARTNCSTDDGGSKIKAVLTATRHALAVAIAFGSCRARVAPNGGYPDVVAVRQFLQRRALRAALGGLFVLRDGGRISDA